VLTLKVFSVHQAKIILLSFCAAVGYGVIHDLITTHVCIEYFSVAHPALFHTHSPVLLACGWGVVATFWMGLVFGTLLARASQSKGLPPVPISKLLKSIFALLTVMGLAATLAGFMGFELSRRSLISIPSAWAGLIPRPQTDRFMAVWFAHGASYLLGIAGALFIILRIWNQRSRPSIISVFPHGFLDLLRAAFLLAMLFVIAWLRLY